MKNGVDMVDHFSIHNIPYQYEHWLHDVIVYLIYNNFGFTGLYISNMVFASILGIMIYFFTKKLYDNEYISLIFTILIIIMMKDFIATRAQLLSYIIFVFEMYSLEMLNNSGKKRCIIYLMLGSVLCSNIHSAVWPMYLVLFLPYFASFLLSKYKSCSFDLKGIKIRKNKNSWLINNDKKFDIPRLKEDNFKWMKYTLFAFVLCILVAFLNPNHNQCFTYFINVKKGTTLSYIGEHQPLILYNAILFLIYLFIISCYLIFNNHSIKLKSIMLLSGLLYLAISSTRHESLFLIVGAFPIIEIFSNLKIERESVRQKIILFFSIFVILISLFLFKTNYGKKYISNDYPKAAIDFLDGHLDKSEITLFNNYNYGSYIIFRNYKVFIDSRVNLYTKSFNKLDYDIFDEWNSIYVAGKYEIIFEKYKITHILIEKNSFLSLILNKDSNYKKIYCDNEFVIYSKKI